MSAKQTNTDITVIIPTQNRAESLRITLECLASANRDGIRAEIIVVDNAGSDHTKDVVESFRDRVAIRYFYEPTLGTFGKSHALNRALDAGGLGRIIAVLDDDMSPDRKWFQAVSSISTRWPDVDIFTGITYPIWPDQCMTPWADRPGSKRLIFSNENFGSSDVQLRNGQWCCGGHFWFRSRILSTGKRFRDIWLTEPDFQLDLAELGYRSVASPEAQSGHRVQPELFNRKVAVERARKTGTELAWLRLCPYKEHVKQARLLRRHRCLGRIFCLLNHLRWRVLYLASYFYSSDAIRFENKLIAMEKMSTYLELFRAANCLDEYSLWERASKASRNSYPA